MKLIVTKAFTDKFDPKKHYQIGHTIEVNDARGTELLNDPRRLVSVVEEKEPKKETGRNARKG